MFRYVAIATVLVVFTLALVTSLAGRRAGRDVAAPRYATATGTPGPPQRDVPDTMTAPPMRGVAPWALSALPECFRQVEIVRGTRAYVAARVGPGLHAVPDGAILYSADCELARGTGTLAVTRAADVRLVVPHVVRFAVAGDGARVRTVVVETATGGTRVLRRYRTPADARVGPARASHRNE